MLRRTVCLAGLIGVLALVTACQETGVPGNGENQIDIRGEAPEEAAHIVADAICGWYAECGMMSIECRSTPGGETQCSGDIYPIRHADCYPEFVEEIQEDFECQDLTPSEERIVNTCITAFVNQDCYTQEDLDATIAAIESGREDEAIPDLPPECMQMASVFDRCASTSTEPVPHR